MRGPRPRGAADRVTGLTNRQCREISRRMQAFMFEFCPDDDEIADTDAIASANVRITITVLAEDEGVSVEEFMKDIDMNGFARGAQRGMAEMANVAVEAGHAAKKGLQ